MEEQRMTDYSKDLQRRMRRYHLSEEEMEQLHYAIRIINREEKRLQTKPYVPLNSIKNIHRNRLK
jgi:hypothetical protein